MKVIIKKEEMLRFLNSIPADVRFEDAVLGVTELEGKPVEEKRTRCATCEQRLPCNKPFMGCFEEDKTPQPIEEKCTQENECEPCKSVKLNGQPPQPNEYTYSALKILQDILFSPVPAARLKLKMKKIKPYQSCQKCINEMKIPSTTSESCEHSPQLIELIELNYSNREIDNGIAKCSEIKTLADKLNEVIRAINKRV